MIRSDVHMHSNFSHDSESAPEEMVQSAIEKGLKMICFTDHYDKDNMDWGSEDIFEPEAYFKEMKRVKEKYQGMIDIQIGVELGLQPHLGDYYREFVKKYPFQFVIGSLHSALGTDVAKKAIFEGRTDAQVYQLVLREMIEDIQNFDDFDTFGHLDYMVRYGAHKEEAYSYLQFSDEIDTILKLLIDKGKALELNMAGIKYGLPFAHPHPDILKRYKELGGEMVTVGADGHRPDHIAYDYHLTADILKSCGFTYYTEFFDRKPVFHQVP